jgi:hypothetical protein
MGRRHSCIYVPPVLDRSVRDAKLPHVPVTNLTERHRTAGSKLLLLLTRSSTRVSTSKTEDAPASSSVKKNSFSDLSPHGDRLTKQAVGKQARFLLILFSLTPITLSPKRVRSGRTSRTQPWLVGAGFGVSGTVEQAHVHGDTWVA